MPFCISGIFYHELVLAIVKYKLFYKVPATWAKTNRFERTDVSEETFGKADQVEEWWDVWLDRCVKIPLCFPQDLFKITSLSADKTGPQKVVNILMNENKKEKTAIHEAAPVWHWVFYTPLWA